MVCRIEVINYKEGRATIIIEGTEGDTKAMIEKIRKLEVNGIEAKKTLSDKIEYGDILKVKDVKEAIKEFIDWIEPKASIAKLNIEEKAIEIFGEKLLQ